VIFLIEKIVITIALAYFIASTIKFIQNYLKEGYWDLSSYIQNGGMPSSHTSTTVALSLSLLLETGFSYIFITAALFTLIVMNDAMKVRFETGEEAKALNRVLRRNNIVYRKLTERVGHTPMEVVAGFLLGILIALIVYAF